MCRHSCSVRDEAPESGQWWRTVTNGSFDCVVVNAEASATKAAVLEACQSGNRKPWLREEVQTRLDCHRQIICDSFSVSSSIYRSQWRPPVSAR